MDSRFLAMDFNLPNASERAHGIGADGKWSDARCNSHGGVA
jgi:hypothetical protein